MATSEQHAPLRSADCAWLSWLAEPCSQRAPPSTAIDASALSTILDAAELHGVLATCLAGLKRPEAMPCGSEGDPTDRTGRRAAIIDAKSSRSLELMSVRMLLGHYGNEVRRSLEKAELPFVLVKGQTFATKLYPSPTFRGYTDIDFLIPIAARPAVSAVLMGHGFALCEMEYRKSQDYFEDKWILDADQQVLIEVHCDLVHNPNLRRDFSLSYDDVLEAGNGDGADPTALLLVAGAHGAVGHQFDRLQQLVDVLQCAKGAAGPIDIGRLRAVSDRCGLTCAIAAALDLAARVFDDASCAALLNELRSSSFDRAAARLLSTRVVMDVHSQNRSRISWRRKLFRQALRYSARRSSSRDRTTGAHNQGADGHAEAALLAE